MLSLLFYKWCYSLKEKNQNLKYNANIRYDFLQYITFWEKIIYIISLKITY